MFIKNDSTEDIRMRWQNCIIRVNGGVYSISEIQKLDKSNISFTGYVYSPISANKYSWLPYSGTFKLKDVDLSFPSLGARSFNGKVRYYYLSSRTSRKLGIHTERVGWFSLSQGISTCTGEELAALYHAPEYCSAKELIDLAEQYKEGALTKYLYTQIFEDQGKNHVILVRGRHEIGIIRDKAVSLFESHSLFSQELEEAGLSIRYIGEKNET